MNPTCPQLAISGMSSKVNSEFGGLWIIFCMEPFGLAAYLIRKAGVSLGHIVYRPSLGFFLLFQQLFEAKILSIRCTIRIPAS